MKKVTAGILAFFALLIVTYLLGPRPAFGTIDNAPLTLDVPLDKLESFVFQEESGVEGLKPDNEARIIWADSSHQKTLYSIVYIHGFSASQGEGFPIHLNIAKKVGVNLYLSRLKDHGIAHPDAFDDITPAAWIKDAKEAIAIGKILGDSIILMSCSTGGTLSIYLAAGDPDIDALVLLSPNIDIYSKATDLLTGPWGKQIAHALIGERRTTGGSPDVKKYWSTTYNTDGLIALQSLVEATMTTDIFKQIHIPVFCGYYYKNEAEQDFVVSVDAMLDFKSKIQTPEALQTFIPFPEAANHVIGSVYKTKHYEKVEDAILQFLDNKGFPAVVRTALAH